jgi:hypothetical protein
MSSYTYTDISVGFLTKAAEVFKVYSDRITFKVLDVEKRRQPKDMSHIRTTSSSPPTFCTLRARSEDIGSYPTASEARRIPHAVGDY